MREDLPSTSKAESVRTSPGNAVELTAPLSRCPYISFTAVTKVLDEGNFRFSRKDWFLHTGQGIVRHGGRSLRQLVKEYWQPAKQKEEKKARAHIAFSYPYIQDPNNGQVPFTLLISLSASINLI